jgi:hypothetical protein
VDFTGLIILGVLWLLLNLMSQGGLKKKKPQEPRRTPSPRADRPQVPRRMELPGGRDATQQEGSRLEQMLREFQRALEEAGSPGRPAPAPTELEEEEERESLEIEPEVVSLETEVSRTERLNISQDDEVEQLVARRISAAASRDQATTRRDHLEFDKRIRQEPADKTATRAYTAQQLRDAMVWREILGPPVGLREEGRSDG